MKASEEQDQFEKERAEQFIAETPMMEGIENIRVELGEDNTGDPAMWLIFRLNSDLNFDIEMARRFNEYAAIIQTKILHSGLSRFPYTRLERAA
jgi:hypothetical protein